jgi:hypothetical protein
MCVKKTILESPLSGHPYEEGSEWSLVREHISNIALALMKVEDKNVTKTGFSYNEVCEIKNRHYYFSKSNAFHVIEKDYWEEAIRRFPERFGTGNAYDVLDAFEELQTLFSTLTRFRDFLRDDTCCYMVEVSEGKITSRTLRVDLFRKIDPSKTDGGDEFTGGLFHANRHFAINDQPLSTNSKEYSIRSISEQLTIICRAFYQGRLIKTKKDNYIASGPFDENHDLKMALYHDDSENLEIFFLNTLHVIEKTKEVVE